MSNFQKIPILTEQSHNDAAIGRVICAYQHTTPSTDIITLNESALTFSGAMTARPKVGNLIYATPNNGYINQYRVISVTPGSGITFTGTMRYYGRFSTAEFGTPLEKEMNNVRSHRSDMQMRRDEAKWDRDEE